MIHPVFPLIALAALTTSGAAWSRPDTRTPVTCIDADRIVTRRVVAPDTIEFTMPRGAVYRSRQQCPNLSELDRTYILQFDHQRGRRICDGDRFRLIDPVAASAGGAAGFPYCRFGTFERVSGQR